jgi:hypothetical protein
MTPAVKPRVSRVVGSTARRLDDARISDWVLLHVQVKTLEWCMEGAWFRTRRGGIRVENTRTQRPNGILGTRDDGHSERRMDLAGA